MSKPISLRNKAIARIEKARKTVAEKTGKDIEDVTPSDIILFYIPKG